MVKIPSIPRKTRGPDWNSSLAGSGQRAGLWGPQI